MLANTARQREPVTAFALGRSCLTRSPIAEEKIPMPYVNIKITRDGATAAQKKRVVQDVTRSLVSVLGKNPEHIHIVIDEVDPENWGYAGMLTTEYREKMTAGEARLRGKRPIRKKKSG